MQAKIDETVKKLNDLEMMQGVIKDAVKDSAKRGTTFDTTQYKWVQEDIEKLTKEIEVAEREQDKLFATGKIDEATCETGKGVDDAWNMLKNREGIWQGANIVQTYMSSFEKNIADVIELIDTEDITGYIPAEKTDRA